LLNFRNLFRNNSHFIFSSVVLQDQRRCYYSAKLKQILFGHVPYQGARCYFPKSDRILVPKDLEDSSAFKILEPLQDEDLQLFTLSLSPNICKVETDEKFKKDFQKFLRFCSRKDYSCDMVGVEGMFEELRNYLKSHSFIPDQGEFDKATGLRLIELLQQQLPFCKSKDGKVGIFKQCPEIPLKIGFDSQLSRSEILHVIVSYQTRYDDAFVDFQTPPNDSWFTHPLSTSYGLGPVVAMLLAMSCYSDTIITQQSRNILTNFAIASHEREVPGLSSADSKDISHRLSSVKDRMGKLVDIDLTQPDHLKQILIDAKIGPLVVRYFAQFNLRISTVTSCCR
jgi:hypothetical protein